MGIRRFYGAKITCDHCPASIKITGKTHFKKVLDWAHERGWDIEKAGCLWSVCCCECSEDN